jgi:hypothetical protein
MSASVQCVATRAARAPAAWARSRSLRVPIPGSRSTAMSVGVGHAELRMLHRERLDGAPILLCVVQRVGELL